MGIHWPEEVCTSTLSDVLGEPKRISKKGEWAYNEFQVPDKKGRLYVNVKKHGVYNCFKSGDKGSFEQLIASYNGWSEDEAVRYIIEKHSNKMDGVALIGSTHNKKETKILINKKMGNLPEKSYKIRFDDKYSIPYIKYLKERGMTDKFITECYYSIVKIMQDKPFEMKNYVIIPYVNEFDKVVYWTGRAINDRTKPRYYNCPDADSGHFVYNIDTNVDVVTIAEGVFKAVKFGTHGLAVGGKNVSDEQIDMIVNKGFKKIIIIPDYEEFDKSPKAMIAFLKKLKARKQNAFIFNWVEYSRKNKIKVKDFSDIHDTELFRIKDIEDYLIDNDYEATNIYMLGE